MRGAGQSQGPLGGRHGELAVGGDEPDPGPPVEQVIDVVGALVGHHEDQLGQRHGDLGVDRGEDGLALRVG